MEKREEERERGTRGNCIADIVSHFTRDTTAAFISLPVPRNQNFNFLVSLESLPPAWEERNSIYGNTKREEYVKSLMFDTQANTLYDNQL